jgi:hypothetical protein
MPLKNIPQESMKFEIQAFKKAADRNKLRETHLPYTGAPQRHPYDDDRVMLVADPYSPNTFYYEFDRADVSYVEELPNLVNMDGEAIAMVRIWVRKMSIGVRCLPFIVDDTQNTP